MKEELTDSDYKIFDSMIGATPKRILFDAGRVGYGDSISCESQMVVEIESEKKLFEFSVNTISKSKERNEIIHLKKIGTLESLKNIFKTSRNWNSQLLISRRENDTWTLPGKIERIEVYNCTAIDSVFIVAIVLYLDNNMAIKIERKQYEKFVTGWFSNNSIVTRQLCEEEEGFELIYKKE